MTFHCYEKCTLEDPIEEFNIEGIAMCIEHHGFQPPMCFAILNESDNLVYNIGKLISQSTRNDEILSLEYVEKSIPQDVQHRQKLIDITVRVLQKLDLFDKKREIKHVEYKLPDRITMPKINKPYPKLTIDTTKPLPDYFIRLVDSLRGKKNES